MQGDGNIRRARSGLGKKGQGYFICRIGEADCEIEGGCGLQVGYG